MSKLNTNSSEDKVKKVKHKRPGRPKGARNKTADDHMQEVVRLMLKEDPIRARQLQEWYSLFVESRDASVYTDKSPQDDMYAREIYIEQQVEEQWKEFITNNPIVLESPEACKQLRDTIRKKVTNSLLPLSANNLNQELIVNDGIFLDSLDVSASAGPGAYSQGSEFTAYEKVFIAEADFKRYLANETPSRLKVIKIVGDSMQPRLMNGQSCVVRLTNEFDQTGIYVFTYNDVLYVKRLLKTQNSLLAISDNPTYPPFTITGDRDFMIHGKVILSLLYSEIQ